MTDPERDRRLAIFFTARGGGVQRAKVSIATELAYLNYQVDVVMPEAEGAYLKELPSEVRLISLKTRNPLKLVLRLREYLEQQRPVALLAAQQQSNIAAVLARQFACVPLILVVEQHNHLSVLAKYDRRLTVRLLPYLARILYPFADEIVAVSHGVAEDLARILDKPPTAIRVIYNPIVSPHLLERSRAVPSHPWLPSPEKPIILAAGRLTRQKDFPTLIRAFARVRPQLDARLIIIGEGEERSHLEHLVQELNLSQWVSLPGFAENPYSYMAHADLFVLSSSWEGLPFVLVEAMAVGTPVVATNCPSGPAEVLQNGKYGLLVPVGDASALAEAIVTTLKSPPNTEQLQARARDFASQEIAMEFSRMLESHLSPSHASRERF